MKKFLLSVLVLCLLLSGMAAAEPAPAEAEYTYNLAASVFPTNWNFHQYQTNGDNELVLQWITSNFYDFDYNDAMDGYELVPVLAADYPVDVTSDYVDEKWGIAEGDTARAWKVQIREGLMWEDGTPIVAQDFATSAKLLLNPAAQNHRADTLYSGNMIVVNAEAYLKQGVDSDTALRAYMDIKGIEGVDAFFSEYGSEKGYVNWANSFGDTYDFEKAEWTGAAEDIVVDSGLTIQELYTFYTEGEGGKFITWAGDEEKKDWALDELFVKYQYPATDFEDVGIFALSDTEFVLVLTKPLEGFYLHYSLTSNWLVNEKLYAECETVTDGVYNNTYGTSAETTLSYGPYKLTMFQSDKNITLEKNLNWFGYSDPANEGKYQTTRIQTDFVAEPSTRHEMFLNGKLDTFVLDKDHIEEYASSDYTYYSEGEGNYAIAFNPDPEALKANETAGINKTILTIKDFRMAMALAMNRAEFVLAADPTSGPSFAIYSSQIVSDPDGGIFYRTTDEAKQVVVNFWGLADEIGPDKMYPTVDDAIDSISGYNLEMAKSYFDSAYDQAIEGGLMTEGDVVEIIIGTPNTTSAFYNSGYDFIVNNYTEAVKGTKLEGKLTFKRDGTLGNGFGDALRNNNVDMLFGVGWVGSTFDPYSLMEAYTSENYQYDPSWDTTVETLDITLDDVTYTATVWDWTTAITGTEITATVTGTGETAPLSFPYSTDSHEAQLRMQVLAALENAILQNYNFIPLMGDSSARLKGMQIEYYTEDEVFPMGRGGVMYLTYNYDDAAWDAYVAEQGGTLNYK